MAVAAKRVGKKYEFATKLILNVHVTPNFVSRKQKKNQIELSCYKPHAKIKMPPTVEMEKAIMKHCLTPILS